MTTKQPDDSTERPNWVKARADCDLEVAFAALYSEAKRDVDDANNIKALTKDDFSFSATMNEGSKDRIFLVRRNMGNSPVKTVLFQRSHDHIRVCGPGTDEFFVKMQWDNIQCRCEIFIEEESQEKMEINEIWEISKRFLEPLFFKASS